MEHHPADAAVGPHRPGRPLLARAAAAARAALAIGTLTRPDCCILATAVLLEVLDYFRINARPLAVGAWVTNPEMHGRLLVEGFPTVEEAEATWFPRGCHALYLGGGEAEPGKWPGHLVAVVEGRTLADLTLDQADRPAHGIALPAPLLAPCDEEFLRGEGVLSGVVNGCRVEYTARPGDRTFQNTPDWQARRRRGPMVAAAIRAARAERE